MIDERRLRLMIRLARYEQKDGKEDLKIAIKTLEDGNNLLEVETIENNNSLDTVDKLKQKIIELDLPQEKSDFLIKKAEIKLKKILGG